VFPLMQPVVVGMAHCCGETEDTWYVLTIFQDTVGSNKGIKWPALYLMAKRGSSSSSSSGSNGGSSTSGGWLYMGETNELPQVQDAEALWSLLQLHVPELLGNTDDDSSSSSDGSGSGGMTAAEVYFLWGAPPLGYAPAPGAAAAAAAAAGSSGGAGGWYLDLLQPGVERLQGTPSSSSRGGGGGWGVGGGLISMDALLEGRQLTTVPAQQEQQR
jgi:hypothetical protein